MKDYYRILGLNRNADEDAVRRAYRRRAKDVHPDVASTRLTAEADFILIREAFDVLGTPDIRAEYDRIYDRLFRTTEEFHYRDFLLKRVDETEFQIKLVCYDLLHQREEDALQMYERLGPRRIHVLSSWLDVEDFMDFGYIIADELFLRREYQQAFGLFYEIALLEEDRPYFRHFYPELLARLIEIPRRKIKDVNPDAIKISMLEKLLDLQFDARDKALVHKQIAEILCGRQAYPQAREHFSVALSLNPGLPGKNRLARDLQVKVQPVEKL